MVGSLQQTVYRGDLALPGIPADAADEARSSLTAATHLGATVSGQAQTAFVDGMQSSLLWAAAAVIAVGFVVVGLLLRGTGRSDRHRAGY